jgi:hypothetical protein
MHAAFFDGRWPIVPTICVGVASYAALIVVLRIPGKRALGKRCV